MVYCGGLENRFGFTADGGSNPSLSAKPNKEGTWMLGPKSLADGGMDGGTPAPRLLNPSTVGTLIKANQGKSSPGQ